MTDTAPLLPDLSIRVDGAMPPRDCVARAVAAEAAGLRAVWFAENAFARGILPAASAVAAMTERLRIVAGVFNPFSRHPTMMAMEIGALSDLSGGRADISIGAGIGAAVEKLGFDPAKPLPALRDTHRILTGLLAGEQVEHDGAAFHARGVRLSFPPAAPVGVFLAGRGDLTLKFCGAAADGLIISNMCSRPYARRAAELVSGARQAAGRSGEPRIVQYLPACIRSDRRAALDGAKRAVGELVPGFWALAQRVPSARKGLVDEAGLDPDEIAAAAEALRNGADAARTLSDAFVLAFAVAGTVDDVLEQAAAYRAVGVGELAMTFTGPDHATDCRLLGGALAQMQ